MLASATACPLCDTETGRQVREGIFGPDFGLTLLAVIAPFPIFALVLAVMHFGPARLFGAKHLFSRTPSAPSDASHEHELQ